MSSDLATIPSTFNSASLHCSVLFLLAVEESREASVQSLARQELVFDEGSGSSGSRYTQKGKSRGTLENSQAGDTWGWCDAEVVNVLHEMDNVGAAFKSDSREGSVCTLRVILTPVVQ